MENPHEERQLMLLERIIKNVHLVNDALVEMTRSVAEINEFNKNVTIVGELWEGVSVICMRKSKLRSTYSYPFLVQYRRNVAFNLSSMEENDRDTTIAQTTANR